MKIDLSKILIAGVRNSRYLEEPIPPATETDVSEFEELIGYRLPDDYRQFLLVVNGGYVNRNVVFNALYTAEALPDRPSDEAIPLDFVSMYTLFTGLKELLNSKVDCDLMLV